MPTRFSSFSISQLLNNFYYEEFVPRACVTKKRRRIQTKPVLLELMESYGSYKTLRDFYYGCIDKAKAGHLYLDLAEWFQDLQAAGFPARDSEAWQIASFPTEEVWAAKEAERKVKHEKDCDAILVECTLRASEFARIRRDKMVRYLEKQPDPLRWRNITALVDRKTLEYVETEVRHIREFEEDCAEGYGNIL